MKFFVFILLSFFAHFGIALGEQISTINLSDKDFSQSTYALDGLWDFDWDADYYSFQIKEKIQVPGFWNDKKNGGHPKFGMGCYKTNVILPSVSKRLALRIDNVHNSYELWINGRLVHKNGNPSRTKEEQIANWAPMLIPLDLDNTNLEIALVVANFGHRNGGIATSITIGEYEKMIKDRDFYMSIDALIIGGLFVLGLFLFSMYLLWKNDTSLLYFLGYAVFFGVWSSFRDEKVFFSLWNDFDWELALRMEYAALIISASFFMAFISVLFPKQNIKLVQNIALSLYAISLFIIIFFPPQIFTYISLSNIVMLILLMGYIFFVFIKANRSKQYNNLYTTISLVLLFTLIILQVVNFLKIVEINKIIIDIVSMLFVLSMAIIFASRFTDIFNSTLKLKEKAERQQYELEAKNTEILASIQYAKQLQATILPTKDDIIKIFQKFFIFYQPKDIVSGDFYWMEEKAGIINFAVADCTGHGVPGAMISFVCSSVLSHVVVDEEVTSPEKILDRCKELVEQRLSTSEISLNDGMDISLGSYNPNTKILQWAGANNPLYIVRKGATEVIEIKGDKQPIGNYIIEAKPFTLHQFLINEGDRIYLFTDGFIDQFGGERGKKYKTLKFKQFILSIQNTPITEQNKLFEKEFNTWKGNKDQIDDVCVCGLEF